MKNEFSYSAAPEPAPIRIEQVILEVPGGGLLKDAGYNVVETTPIGRAVDGKYQVIKNAKVVTKYTTGTTLEVAKGSGIATNDFIAFGGMAVKVTEVNTSNADKDVLTISALTGKTIEVGQSVYQAAAAADGTVTMASPVIKPIGIAGPGHYTAENGIVAFGGNGDTQIKVILAGTVRKETCMFGEEIEDMLKGIHRV